MAVIVPSRKPQLPVDTVTRILQKNKVRDAVALLGVRAYYRDTMGVPGKNDVGIYDDAIFIRTPECFMTFNANCDPTRLKPKVAQLKTGLWKYKVGIHGLSKPKEQRYTALVQAAPVTVQRYQGDEDAGYLGLNLHRGDYSTTSSLGCQTIYPPQWDSFIETVQDQLKRYNQKVVPYLLIDGPLV